MSFPYISRVEIVNFRNFSEFSVDLATAAVLVGENKVGKSNFIHALRLVLDPSLPDSQRHLRSEDFWDGLQQPFSGETIEIVIQVRGFDDDEAAKCVLADCLLSQDPLTAQLTYCFRPRSEIDEEAPTEDHYEFIVYGGEDEKTRVGSDVRRWLSVVALPALRDAESQLRSWRASPLRPLLDRARSQLSEDSLEDVKTKLEEATAVLLGQDAIRDLQTEINKRSRSSVGPLHTVATEFGFAASEPDQLLRSLRLYLKETQLRPLSDASLGTANIIYLALLLQDLDAKCEARALVSTVLAIEEPEAHLHPHLQRLLFRYFLNRNHAVVVTTHSPHLASVAPLHSLVLLRTVVDSTQSFSLRELALPDNDVTDLQRYIDVTRAEMLFAKGVILVEGMAEQFLVPAFAEHLLQARGIASSLDELGITVSSVNGADFRPYYLATSHSGWNIHRAVVTDGDRRSTNGAVVYDGLRRGARLLSEEDKEEIDGLLAEDDFDGATDALHQHGIFVGKETLELDLLSSMAREMKRTYSDLVGSTIASNRFNALVDSALDEDTAAAKKVVARIERIGKGRFAQRLAGEVTEDHEAPAHIADAVEHVATLITDEYA